MSWERCEREDVQLGDRIRLVVPEVLAIAEGSDGRPAFGYGQSAVFVERWADDDPDPVRAALAGAGIGDLRRGIPLDDWKAEAGPDGIRISGRLPDGVVLDDLSQYSVLHPARVADVDEQVVNGADGRILWRRLVTPDGAEVTTAVGDLPRCGAVDPDEGVCLWTTHDDSIEHWFSMFAHAPQVPSAEERRS